MRYVYYYSQPSEANTPIITHTARHASTCTTLLTEIVVDVDADSLPSIKEYHVHMGSNFTVDVKSNGTGLDPWVQSGTHYPEFQRQTLLKRGIQGAAALLWRNDRQKN